jgi:hypothetical protein
MTSALTPELALRYLAELEPSITAAAVVAADGRLLAGDAALAARLAAAPDGPAGLLLARSSRHAVVARVGPGALGALVQHDLDLVARELDGEAWDETRK